jgi:endonuclease III
MSQRSVVGELLEEHGMTYAAGAGIALADKPAPLYQLLVLTMLSSTRIAADIAVEAARALFAKGWRTPERMLASTWQQRVNALGSAGYRRYDESTATALERLSRQVRDDYHGDLRRLRPASHDDVPALEKAVTSFQRIGPTGAGVFCREVQAVWPEVAPYFDKRALAKALELGLPTDPAELASLAPEGRLADLAAALVRAR